MRAEGLNITATLGSEVCGPKQLNAFSFVRKLSVWELRVTSISFKCMLHFREHNVVALKSQASPFHRRVRLRG